MFLLVSFSARAAQISNLRIGQGVGNVRVVFDADSKFNYKVFLLNEPRRLVVDTQNIEVSSNIEKTTDPNNLISSTRLGTAGVGGVRVVFDLIKPVTVKNVFMLPPQSNFSWRFVIDLELASERDFTSKVGNDHAFSSDAYNKGRVSVKNNSSSKAAFTAPKTSKKVIVLDAGHGGVDPGAIGIGGTYEKHITLAMAKELQEELDKTGRYKVYLTRNRDIFIPLRKRVQIARQHDADLFVSIHADSAANKRATGLSVYTLSEKASDKEAAALAEKENKADIVAGLDFAEHSKEVSDVLLNLAQRETLNRSAELATFMVQEMRKSIRTLHDTHRFAGFAVLKAPDVPSVLVELGYLSNRTEEKQLKQKSYRKKLSTAAVKAINKYFENMQRASVF
ncbi:MAG: N-acetylmuramoyl-L-alanine amidase [Alphaproteobacteria bacterium]|nr:N-acetylmuramoyl-L-alanine amidase [Alphaproteobacteria bacterium]